MVSGETDKQEQTNTQNAEPRLNGPISPDIERALAGVPSNNLSNDLRVLEEVGHLISKNSQYDPRNPESALYKTHPLGRGPMDRQTHAQKLEQVRKAVFASIDSHAANATPGEDRQSTANIEKMAWEKIFSNSRVREDFSYEPQIKNASTTLDLTNANVTKISPTVFALPGLKSLNLANNRLSDIRIPSFATTLQLNDLNVQGNPLQSLNTVATLAERGTRVVMDDPKTLPLPQEELDAFQARYNRMEKNGSAAIGYPGGYQGIHVPADGGGYKRLGHLSVLESHTIYEKLTSDSYTLVNSSKHEEVGQQEKTGHIAARFTFDTKDGRKEEVQIQYEGGHRYGDRKAVTVKCNDKSVELMLHAYLNSLPMYNARQELTGGNLERRFANYLGNNRQPPQEVSVAKPERQQRLSRPANKPLLSRLLSFIGQKLISAIDAVVKAIGRQFNTPQTIQTSHSSHANMADTNLPSYQDLMREEKKAIKASHAQTDFMSAAVPAADSEQLPPYKVSQENKPPVELNDSKRLFEPTPPPPDSLIDNDQSSKLADTPPPSSLVGSPNISAPPVPQKQTASLLAKAAPGQRVIPFQNNKAFEKKYGYENGDFVLKRTGQKAFTATQEDNHVRIACDNFTKEILTDIVRIAKIQGATSFHFNTNQNKKLALEIYKICSREGITPLMGPDIRPSPAEAAKVQKELLAEVKDMPKEEIFKRHKPNPVDAAEDIPVGSTLVNTTADGLHIFMKPGSNNSAIGPLYAIPASKVNPPLNVGHKLTELHQQGEAIGAPKNTSKAKGL